MSEKHGRPTASARIPGAQAGSSPAGPPGGPQEQPVDPVVRRTSDGWRVGDDEVPDLTSAMVLADLLAAELPTQIQPAIRDASAPSTEAARPAAARPAAAHTPAAASQPATFSSATSRAAASPRGTRRPATSRSGTSRSGTSRSARPPRSEMEDADRLRTTVGQLEHALAARVRIEQAIGVLAERHRIRPRQAFEQLRSAARNRGRKVIDIAGDVVASATNPLLQLPEELTRQRSGPRHPGRHARHALGSE